MSGRDVLLLEMQGIFSTKPVKGNMNSASALSSPKLPLTEPVSNILGIYKVYDNSWLVNWKILSKS